MKTGEKQREVDKLDTLKKVWYSPADIGRMMRPPVSKRTIIREIERGRITAVQTPGGQYRIDRTEYLRYSGQDQIATGCKV